MHSWSGSAIMETSQPSKIASFFSVGPAPAMKQRTEWAEHHVEELLSIPFVSEFVCRNVQTSEGRKREQVADFLIAHRGGGILVELKCQEAPGQRTPKKLELWARKKAKAGSTQLRRAFTRRRDFPIWCDHPRRGRVEFPNGLPSVQHAMVAVEVSLPVDLRADARSLPLEHDGVPITYLSVSDFLNLAIQLRSVPELTDYLGARRSLPSDDLRMLGDEETLFGFYLLNDGSFAGCSGRSGARSAIAARQERLRAALRRKQEADQYADFLEHVMRELATRNPKFSDGVPPALLQAYDPPCERRNYLEMQAALADLHLRERTELGRALHGAAERLIDKTEGFTFRAARFDSMAEWVYLVGASRGGDRRELLSRMQLLVGGAMAFYNKPKCVFIVDRHNSGFEVALSRPGGVRTQAHVEAGERFFGGLRITTTPLHFLPDQRA